MLTYPASIIGYFVLGVGGACTFLFLLLMFDKDIAILKNQYVKKLRWMIVIYAILGGLVSVVVNLASNPNFDTGQFTLAFSAGIGWPALATGVSAAKKIGDINEAAEKKIDENTARARSYGDREASQRDEWYLSELEKKDKALKTVQELFDKEIDRVKEYFSGLISSTEGGER
jgi:hypothetical protein